MCLSRARRGELLDWRLFIALLATLTITITNTTITNTLPITIITDTITNTTLPIATITTMTKKYSSYSYHEYCYSSSYCYCDYCWYDMQSSEIYLFFSSLPISAMLRLAILLQNTPLYLRDLQLPLWLDIYLCWCMWRSSCIWKQFAASFRATEKWMKEGHHLACCLEKSVRKDEMRDGR